MPSHRGAAPSPTLRPKIANCTNGIVPCVTTGESATLAHAEHERVVAFTVEAARRRVPVIAGAGSNSTDEAIALTKHAKQAGADGALLITPYYNKPTQEGLFRHYKAVADAVDLPLVLYNIPGRTASNMLPETWLNSQAPLLYEPACANNVYPCNTANPLSSIDV